MAQNLSPAQNRRAKLISLLEENVSDYCFVHDGARPAVRTEQLLYCKSSSVGVLLGVAFGHRDLQTSSGQTSFWKDFSTEDFIRITQESWRNGNRISNILLSKKERL
jgi:hypothetical protein